MNDNDLIYLTEIKSELSLFKGEMKAEIASIKADLKEDLLSNLIKWAETNSKHQKEMDTRVNIIERLISKSIGIGIGITAICSVFTFIVTIGVHLR